MKKFLLLIPLVILHACGGDSPIDPNGVFVKYYGTLGIYQMKDMITSLDGNNIVMFGSEKAKSTVTGLEDTNFYIVVANLNGNYVNEMTHTIVHQSDDFKNEDDSFIDKYQVERPSRITAIDGGYLVVGTTEYPILVGGDEGTVDLIIYAQLDLNLSLVGDWMMLGDSVNNYVGVDIAETADGGILVAGYTDVNGSNDLYCAKVGGTNPSWTRDGFPERPVSDDRLIRALPTNSGQFALFGQTDALTEGKRGVNVERTVIDQEGVIINSLIYGNTSDAGDSDIDDYPFDVVEKPGGFAVIGYSDLGGGSEKPFFMSVDLTGASTNEVLYDTDFFDNVNARGFSITQTLSNDIILVGQLINFKSRNGELMFMRTDQGGTRIGDVKNFGVENGNDVGIRVVTTPDGSILVGGTYEFGVDLSQFVLLKMNTDGELKQ